MLARRLGRARGRDEAACGLDTIAHLIADGLGAVDHAVADHLDAVANEIADRSDNLLINEGRSIVCAVHDGGADVDCAVDRRGADGLRTVESCGADVGGAVPSRLDPSDCGSDASIDGAANSAVGLLRPGAHDDLELVDAHLAVLVRVRRCDHLADLLIVQAIRVPLRVQAQNVRLHLGGVDLAVLVRVHLGEGCLKPFVRLVNVLAKHSLEARGHAGRI